MVNLFIILFLAILYVWYCVFVVVKGLFDRLKMDSVTGNGSVRRVDKVRPGRIVLCLLADDFT